MDVPKRKNLHTACSVATCQSMKNVCYYRIPKDGRQKSWIAACRRTDNNLNPLTAKVCEMHFAAGCFLRDLENELLGLPIRKRLKKDAIPTLYLNTLVPESDHHVGTNVERSSAVLRKQSAEIATTDSEVKTEANLEWHATLREERKRKREAKLLVDGLLIKAEAEDLAEKAREELKAGTTEPAIPSHMDAGVTCHLFKPDTDATLNYLKIQLMKERRKVAKLLKETKKLKSEDHIKKQVKKGVQQVLRKKFTPATTTAIMKEIL